MIGIKRFTDKQSDFENMLNEAEKSKNTTRAYMLALRNFTDFTRKSGGCTKICKDTVIAYKEYLIRTYSSATSNQYIIGLNNYLRFLGQGDLCIKTFRLQRCCSLENGLTMEEYHKLLEAAKKCDNTSYYVIRVLACTGIRVSELEYITVDAVRNGGCTVSNKGKVRDILIKSGVCAELMELCEIKSINDGFVFPGKNGKKPLHPTTVRRWMKCVAGKAGIDLDKAFPHNLRHFFAGTYMNEYNDITGLADLLGHDDISTTRIYIQKTKEEKRAKLECLDL